MLVTTFEGKTIYDQALDHSGGIVSRTLQLPSTAPAGIYLLIIKGNGPKMVRSFVVG